MSKFVHFSLAASPNLAAVSFSSWRSIGVFPLLVPVISMSTSFSVGMKGTSCVFVYLGLSHCIPRNFRYCV